MLWLYIAFLGPILHALANIFDNYFMNRLVQKPMVLAFLAMLIDALFLPLVFVFQRPELPPARLIPYFVLLGLTNVGYLYPYYKALQGDDTSVVAALFSLGKVFVPFLAFLMVREVLSVHQYIGFFIIIFSSAALSLNNHDGKLRLNSSFWYMALCTLILAFEAVIYKYVVTNVSWSTGFTWGTVFSLLLILPVFLFRKRRREFSTQLPSVWKNLHLFVGESFLTFAGSAAGVFAVSLAPVTLIEGIDSFQPFFVLLYALLFTKFFPKVFKEKISVHAIIKKILLFAIMILGIILATT